MSLSSLVYALQVGQLPIARAAVLVGCIWGSESVVHNLQLTMRSQDD